MRNGPSRSVSRQSHGLWLRRRISSTNHLSGGWSSGRALIRDRYEYRFVTTADGAAALARRVQRGALSAGKPFLNPL